MVGRLREHRLYVSGVDSGTGLRTVVNDAAQGLGLSLELRPESLRRRRITRRSTRRAARSCSSSPARTTTTTGPATRGTRSTRRAWPAVATLAARVVDAVAGAATPPAWVKVDAPPATAGRAGAATAPTSAWSRTSAEVLAMALRPACGSAACGLAARRTRPDSRAATSIVRFAGVERAHAGRSHVRAARPARRAIRSRSSCGATAASSRCRPCSRSDADVLRDFASAASSGSGPPVCSPAAPPGVAVAASRPTPRLAPLSGGRRSARAASGQSPPADDQRPERGSVLRLDGNAAGLPVHAAAVRMRPDLHDEDRRHATCGWSPPGAAARRAASSSPTAAG